MHRGYTVAACGMITDIDSSSTFGYTSFTNTLEVTFGFKQLHKDIAHLQEVLSVISSVFMETMTFIKRSL